MRRLDNLLDRASCRALAVVADSSRDPYVAPFTGSARLGPCLLIAPRGRAPRLGFLSPLDRDEAAASGLDLLDPEMLDVERWTRGAGDGQPGGASDSELLAGVLSRALHLSELAPGRLALAGCLGAGTVIEACGQLSREGWSFAAGEPLVMDLRKRKTPAQLDAVRRAAGGAVAALLRVAELLAAARTSRQGGVNGTGGDSEHDGELWLEGEPLRVGRLRRAIARELADRGLEQPAGNIVAPAAAGAVPHTSGRDQQVVKAGESLVVDVFPRGRMFADCTRTFCVGRPPEPLARAHARVVEVLELARGSARPGVRGWSLQESVCQRLDAAGYPTPITDRGTTRGYVHGLGHGVGFEVHEYPSFKEEAGEEGMLEAGDVITLEPGLYDPGAGWGVRIEDLYALGDGGLETLTPLPYDLDPRAW